MSAAENRKLMESIFARIASGDRAAFLDALADDVTMRVTGQYSWSRTFEGKATLVRELYGYLNTLLAEGRRTIPLRIIADDDHVAVEARGEMQTKAGVPYNNEYCLIYCLKDGRIVEITEYCDSALTEAVLGKFPALGSAESRQPAIRIEPQASPAVATASAGNKRLMQEIFAGLASRDGKLLIDSMSDDFRWIGIGTNKWSGTFGGREAVLRDLLGPLRAKLIERSRTVAHRFIAGGDYVVVEARGDNVTWEGKQYNNEYCFVFRLSEGKIREVKEYADTALIEAVLGDRSEALAAQH